MSSLASSLVFLLVLHSNSDALKQRSSYHHHHHQAAIIPTYSSSTSGSSSSPPTSSSPTYLTYHPHHQNPSPFYHQNVYLGPGPSAAAASAPSPTTSYAYSYTGNPSSSSANLYTYGVTGGGTSPAASSQMMVASSSSQPVLTALPPPTMQLQSSEKMAESSLGDKPNKDGSSPSLGIVFGRPLSGYDGNYYVPVFYPLSWLPPSQQQPDPMAAYSSTQSASTLQAPPTYAYQSPYHSPPSYYYPQPQYPPTTTAHSQPTTLYRMIVPVHQSAAPVASYRPYYYNSHVQQLAHKAAEEMMPSDVTPDMNGNFKRSANQRGHMVTSSMDDAGSYFFGDPTTMMSGGGGGGMDYSQEQNGGQGGQQGPQEQMAMAGDGSNGYYYITSPMIKFRDPKDEMNLAIEASKEQYNAQKRFEKEVLLSGDLHPSAPFRPLLDPRQGITRKRPSNVSEDSDSTRDSQIESRSSGPDAKAPVAPAAPINPASHEPPIVTSIEIFDLPGANKYLGLGDSSPAPAPGVPQQNSTATGIPHPSTILHLPFVYSPALSATKFYRRKLVLEEKP